MITQDDFDYIKKNFRFKTKEEMSKEFGVNWRYCHSISFIEEMDYLLGKSLSDVYLTHYIIDGLEDIFAQADGFFVGTHMITKKEIDNNMSYTEAVKKIQESVENIYTPQFNIKSVTFDDNKKIVTVVLKDGRVGVSRCNSTDEYDQSVGFCIAYTNATFGSRNQVTKLVKHYNGEEKKKNEEKKLREEILREIKLEEYKKKVKASNKKREQKKEELRKKIEKELKNKK